MSALKKFARGLSIKRYVRGQSIIHQGDALRHAYLVKSGVVKTKK